MRILLLTVIVLLFLSPVYSSHTSNEQGAHVGVGGFYHGNGYENWKKSDFSATLRYKDSNMNLNNLKCKWAIEEYLSGSWTQRASGQPGCTGVNVVYQTSINVDVGTGALHCASQGFDKCRISAWIENSDGTIRWSKQYAYVSLDWSNPSTTIEPISTGWYNYDLTFYLTCTDSYSGCKETRFWILDENDNWIYPEQYQSAVGTSYTITCPFGSTCTRKVKYYSADNVLLEEGTKTKTYYIDKTAPTPNPAEMESVTTSTNSATVTAKNAGDTGSGMSRYIFHGGSGPVESSSRSTTVYNLQPDTEYCFSVEYRDNSGNVGGRSSSVCGRTTIARPYMNSGSYALSPSSIQVSINPNGNPSHVEYQVRAHNSAGTVVATTPYSTSTNPSIYDLPDPNYQYKFSVRARGSTGYETSWSDYGGYRYTLAKPIAGLTIASNTITVPVPSYVDHAISGVQNTSNSLINNLLNSIPNPDSIIGDPPNINIENGCIPTLVSLNDPTNPDTNIINAENIDRVEATVYYTYLDVNHATANSCGSRILTLPVILPDTEYKEDFNDGIPAESFMYAVNYYEQAQGLLNIPETFWSDDGWEVKTESSQGKYITNKKSLYADKYTFDYFVNLPDSITGYIKFKYKFIGDGGGNDRFYIIPNEDATLSNFNCNEDPYNLPKSSAWKDVKCSYAIGAGAGGPNIITFNYMSGNRKDGYVQIDDITIGNDLGLPWIYDAINQIIDAIGL